MKLFISHSSVDDAFVRELNAALVDQGQPVWIDSRELRGSDMLWPEIQQALEAASAYAVVVSPAALQSKWVGKELRHALKLSDERGKDRFPIIPLSLDGTKLGVLEEFFGDEPVYIPVSSAPGGVEAAIHPILVSLGQRDPDAAPPTPQPTAEPLEELVLELTDLKFEEKEGKRRATSRARLVYQPAKPGRDEVRSAQSWRLVAPIGPIEAADLSWYLEKYAIWPSGLTVIQDRARQVVENLVTWGRLLNDAAFPPAHVSNVREAWARIDDHAGRRFSVYVDIDEALEAGASKDQIEAAKEAATLLLGLPWELLHDGKGYLFQGAKPTRVRRRLPLTESRDVSVVAPPVRILLVSARPEDEACGYIDHRVSALPLVEAMEALPGLVKLHVLGAPTLPALRAELDRARAAKEPYHVVHFDGHGVYDRAAGLGGLCFEHPEDTGKLERRRHETVFTDQFGPLLRDHRIPLVFLEACQTAQAGKASESVASQLLKVGVASVVAMSHSVLVETARRFVATFYQALADGKRVGDAMLAGQRELADNPSRGRVFGADELRLHDWFVPVLFQEKDDPQLFRATPSRQTVEDFKTRLAARFGELPPVPATGFVGRSRDLLALQRLLLTERYAVIRGQGGEGKTTLAAEFARWMVRSQQVHRVAFVSIETHGNARAVVDALGRQLVGKEFSAAGDLDAAIRQVEHALREQPTLLIVDNLESILLPPFLAEQRPEALDADAKAELMAILGRCASLQQVGATRIVFTSREPLPAPFDAARNRRELHQLNREDAVKLVERTLDADGKGGGTTDAAREEIEQLVDAVHGHARTLALLAPALRSQGVAATRASLVELMTEMERKFPGSREQSVFASVELSLRRLSPENLERVRVLGLFHGGVQLGILQNMMQWAKTDVSSLAQDLVATGLATLNRYEHLTLNPALCPYLRRQLEATKLVALSPRWVEAMRGYAGFLKRQQDQNIEIASTLTGLELPNLFALLDLVQGVGNAEVTINLTADLYGLLQWQDKPQLLERIGRIRDAAAATLGKIWSHACFTAARTRIEQQWAGGRLKEALDGARTLLQRAQSEGVCAYHEADYDLALAHFTLARVLLEIGGAEQAMSLLDEARQRFDSVAQSRPSPGAERMASVCRQETGDCLLDLGRLDKAAAVHEECIRLDEKRGDARGIAVGKAQLGSVRLEQRRYPEALTAYTEARERFVQLDEPGSVAVAWHQTGRAYQGADQPVAAEDAYRKSLAIRVRLGDGAGQADALYQLGTLYDRALSRLEDAVAFYRQAADKYGEMCDGRNEGTARSSLAKALHKLHRLDEARKEVRRAIECTAQFGYASKSWTSWASLSAIETDSGQPSAAAEAKHRALAAYLDYRHDGGENHDPVGRLCLAVTQALQSGDPAQAVCLLQQELFYYEGAGYGGFVHALQAIVAGRRERILAEDPDLTYMMAAEILILLETLERPSA